MQRTSASKILAVVVFALLLPSRGLSQNCYSTNRPDQPADKVGWAHDFLYVFFPEFDDPHGPTRLTVTDNLKFGYFRNCNFYLFTATLKTRESLQTCSTDPVTHNENVAFAQKSDFNFRRDSLLSSWEPSILPTRLSKLRAKVDSHPEWTDTDIHRELLSESATYLPENRDEFIRSFPLDRLRVLFGDVRVAEAEFSYRPPAPAGEKRYAELSWTVVVEIWRNGKRNHSYTFSVEPFAGKPYRVELHDTPNDFAYRELQKQRKK